MKADNPPWESYSEGALLQLLAGDRDAFNLVTAIAFLSHVYDDLIDADKPVAPADLHRAMWLAMIEIPGNPFYQKHRATLAPLLAASILNWRAANDMEASGSLEELRIAHALRYQLADVLIVSMALIGGAEYAAAHARRARLMAQRDTWEHYLREHRREDASESVPQRG